MIQNLVKNLLAVYTRVGPDIRCADIDFCRVSRYPLSGFLKTGYPVSGQFTGFTVSCYSAGLSGRIISYFERKFIIYSPLPPPHNQ